MKILFVGAAGSGMGNLIAWHYNLHDEVVVHDDGLPLIELQKKYPYAEIFDANNTTVFDRAVFSDAIPQTHLTRTYANRFKIPMRGYAEELSALLRDRNVIAIAGTHGKSTTTALISWTLAVAGLDPLCIIGAEIADWHGGFRMGNGPVVIEADEFRKHFLHLEPTTILITSLEIDHFDTYKTEEELIETFATFCKKTSVQSVFIARGTPALDKLSENLARSGRSHIRFGNEDDLAYPVEVEIKNGRSHISTVFDGAKTVFEINSLASPHISNTIGAIAILAYEGVSIELAQRGLSTFPGIRRRLEHIGSITDMPIYSDYAHHPTAVRETLNVVRRIFPDTKIAVVFEPHERLRTAQLREEYNHAFDDADAIALLPVYDPIGRERTDISEDAVTLRPAQNTTYVPNYESAFAWAKKFTAGTNDEKILITMGAGPVDGFFRKKLMP